MVNPEWFFSTLAQSSAAIAGFVIAFSGVLYQIERQKREERTGELRNEFMDIRDKYVDRIRSCKELVEIPHLRKQQLRRLDLFDFIKKSSEDSIQIDGNISYDLVSPYIDTVKQRKELTEAHRHSDLTEEDVFWLSFSHIGEILGSIESSNDPKEDQLLSIQEIELLIYFVDKSLMMHKFAPVYTSSNMTTEEVKKYTNVLQELRRDLETVERKSKNTILGYSPKTNNIIIGSGVLILTGVFVPMVFLISLPISLSNNVITNWLLTVTQTLLIILNMIITVYLIWGIMGYMNPSPS